MARWPINIGIAIPTRWILRRWKCLRIAKVSKRPSDVERCDEFRKEASRKNLWNLKRIWWRRIHQNINFPVSQTDQQCKSAQLKNLAGGADSSWF